MEKSRKLGTADLTGDVDWFVGVGGDLGLGGVCSWEKDLGHCEEET